MRFNGTSSGAGSTVWFAFLVAYLVKLLRSPILILQKRENQGRHGRVDGD